MTVAFSRAAGSPFGKLMFFTTIGLGLLVACGRGTHARAGSSGPAGHPSAWTILDRARRRAQVAGTGRSTMRIRVVEYPPDDRAGRQAVRLTIRSEFFVSFPDRARSTIAYFSSASGAGQRGEAKLIVDGKETASKRATARWTCFPSLPPDSSGGIGAYEPARLYRPNFLFTSGAKWVQSAHFIRPAFTLGLRTWLIQLRYRRDIAQVHEAGTQTVDVFVARGTYKVVRISLAQTISTPGTPDGHVSFSERFSHYGEPLKIVLPCGG